MNKEKANNAHQLLVESKKSLFDIQHVTDMMRHHELSRETICGIADLIDRVDAFVIGTMSFAINAVEEDMQQEEGE